METTKLLDSPELLKGPQATAFLGPRCFCPFPRERRSAWHQRRATEADVDCDGTGPGPKLGNPMGNPQTNWSFERDVNMSNRQRRECSNSLLVVEHCWRRDITGVSRPQPQIQGPYTVYRYFVLILVCTNNYTRYNIIYIYIYVCVYAYMYMNMYIYIYMYDFICICICICICT